MTKEQRKFLHDEIADILNLPKNKVIWAYQNQMPEQKPPFVLIRIWGKTPETREELRPIKDGEYLIYVSEIAILEVQYFAGIRGDVLPDEELEKLARMFETPLIVDKFFEKRIAVYSQEPIQDLTELLEGVTYEYRALVEFRIRYGYEIIQDLGAIETVKIKAEYDSIKDAYIGGYLIHGNLDETGKVSDLTRAIPVALEIKTGGD